MKQGSNQERDDIKMLIVSKKIQTARPALTLAVTFTPGLVVVFCFLARRSALRLERGSIEGGRAGIFEAAGALFSLVVAPSVCGMLRATDTRPPAEDGGREGVNDD